MVTRDAIGRQDDVVIEVTPQGDHGARQRHNAVLVAGGLYLQLEPYRRLGHLVEDVKLLMEHHPRRQSFESDKSAAQRVGHLRAGLEALARGLGHRPFQ